MSVEIKVRPKYLRGGMSKQTTRKASGNSGTAIKSLGPLPVGMRRKVKPGRKRYL